MKKLFVAVMVWVAVAGSAQANLRVFGSYWGAGELNEGFGGGVGLRAELLPFLGIDVRGSYLQFDGNEDVSMIPIETAGILQLPVGLFVPYVGAGAGYYILENSRSVPDDKFGVFALLGLEVGRSEGLRFFTEGRWVALESKLNGSDSEMDGYDDTVSLTGVGVNVGIVWDW
jgi:hypothetical protein